MEQQEVAIKTFIKTEMITATPCGRKKFDLLCKLGPGASVEDKTMQIENDEPGYIIVDLVQEPGKEVQRAKVKGWVPKINLEIEAYPTKCIPFGIAHEAARQGIPIAKTEELTPVEGTGKRAMRYLYIVVNEANQKTIEEGLAYFFPKGTSLNIEYKFDIEEREHLAKAEIDQETDTVLVTVWDITEEEVCETYVIPFVNVAGKRTDKDVCAGK
ncbi:hypothetical protein [uncultured Parabacteroides sp.]|uniref:hypothetical protein n=1 Tax=uncultured Parabacteroides sp. TaxID=512312 RepID=UPI0025D5043D|nr:hypothetical protein [uncultured Parabacteroides sp.]